jgi:alcohol dehydrogenase class IV
VRLTESAYGNAGGEPDRDALALAALLSGYTIDQAGLALHHVLSQTIVRLAGGDHGPTNAAMLPHTIGALRRRNPATIDATAIARELARRAGAERLRDIGVDESKLEDCVQAAAQRPQLKLTPPPAGEEEIRALYRAAW